MKIPATVTLLLGFGTAAFAQFEAPAVVERGPHHRVLQSVTESVDSEGARTFITNRVVELGNSMHYWDGKDWQVSDATFEVLQGGTVAQHVPYQLILAPNLMDDGAVDFYTPDGKRFLSNPAFLAYRDLVTRESVIVSSVKASLGKLSAPSEVLFEDAFEDITGSIRFRLSNEGMEQDVLLQGKVPSPAELGLDPGDHPMVLEMWTLFSAAPSLENFAVVPAGELTDLEMHFGAVWIGQGKAFEVGAEASGAPVAKRWGPIDNPAEKWLVEIVHLDDVGPALGKLQGNVAKPGKVKRMAQKKTRSDKDLIAGFARAFEPKEKRKGTMMAVARPSTPKGSTFVIDYQTLSSGQTNYTFQSDTTYYISASLTMSGLTTFEGGAVIKYAPTNIPNITISSNVVWTGQAYRPVIMTARDDHSVGERIGTNALSGVYADIALFLSCTVASSGANINNLQIRYANNSIKILTRNDHIISNVQFVNCNSGIKTAASTGYKLRNALFDNVRTNFTGATSTADMEHVTSDSADYFNYSGASLTINIKNSILAGITSVGTINSSQNVAILASNSGLFQTAVSGRHYLTNDTYRNIGTTNVACLPDIQKKTTYPPVILTGPFGSGTTWFPMATRDTDTPDYGFHYDPLDIVVKEATATGAVVLTGGVAVGVYGTYGLILSSGSSFLSDGKPDALNRLVKYNTVQSSTNVWDTNGATFALLRMTNTPSTRPDIHLRFTDVSLLADTLTRRSFLDAGNITTRYTPNQIRLKDSQFLNAEMTMNPDTAGLAMSFTNCLFQRVYFSLVDGVLGSKGMNVRAQNNTFIKGTLGLTHSTNTYTWGLFDNFFETASLSSGGTLALSNGTNGYKSTTVLGSTLGGDVALTSADFQSGALGSFYYNTNSSATNTFYLINRSTNNTPALVGLYHYTTRPDQAKDGASTGLDIGFHYIATTGSTSTTPFDFDGDGIPDYLEDLNGDNAVQSGETSSTQAGDRGLWIRITDPKDSSNIP